MRQSSFDFPFLDNYLDDDFLVAFENSKAFEFITNYDLEDRNLPKIFVIYGKKYSGKSHLSHIWQRLAKADFLDLDNLDDETIANHIEENKAYIIENIEQITNQTVLFHIFNIVLERNCHLMLTSNTPLGQIKYDFADIASRLKNVFSIEIKDPEIDFIKMLLIKQFSVKQLLVEDKVIDYLAKNINRNYEAIVQVSKLLEFYCFEKKKKITIPFVSEVLGKMSG